MSQIIQLLLLLALCMIYLFNFEHLNSVREMEPNMRAWWEGFLILSNLALGAFVVTAVSTRFVFPSVSLEGQSFWILQSAPISFQRVLQAKLWAWYTPIGLISSVIFASGAFAVNAEPHIVGVSVLSCWIMNYGLIGLAVGLGAVFAQFSWEHASQVASSFGSLLYMLAGTAVVGVDIFLAGGLMVLRILRNGGVHFTIFEWYGSVVGLATVFVYLNYALAQWALRAGERALKAQR